MAPRRRSRSGLDTDAAAQAQAALDGGTISVRIGMHTGKARLTDEGYVGRELHLAARIAAAGHGGQILISQTTQELLDGDLTDVKITILARRKRPPNRLGENVREIDPQRLPRLRRRRPQPHPAAASHAELAEAAGDQDEAARLYADAAERWRQFANVPERGYALLGQGRCLPALGRNEEDEPLREARELFASMGYKRALGETEALLGHDEAAAR